MCSDQSKLIDLEETAKAEEKGKWAKDASKVNTEKSVLHYCDCILIRSFKDEFENGDWKSLV